jgi:hypothetical protein
MHALICPSYLLGGLLLLAYNRNLTISPLSLVRLQNRHIPLAGRLSQFPDAWLLPLFPLLLRLVYLACQSVYQRRLTVDVHICRRLALYFFLFNVRGWFLYLTLNSVEDSIVAPVPDECWYSPFYASSCSGRVFDFSDHIVLYMAQLLPIALAEFVYAWETPYWRWCCSNAEAQRSESEYIVDDNDNYDDNNKDGRRNQSQDSNSISSALSRVLSWLYPLMLTAGLAYLYFITLIGAYKTSLYFHTGGEVLMGLVVSLWIHVPLWWIQSGLYAPSHPCSRLRSFFFPSAIPATQEQLVQ